MNEFKDLKIKIKTALYNQLEMCDDDGLLSPELIEEILVKGKFTKTTYIDDSNTKVTQITVSIPEQGFFHSIFDYDIETVFKLKNDIKIALENEDYIEASLIQKKIDNSKI